MAVAIKTENLSKAYQLGQIGTGTLQNDFKRWHAKARGKEDPFLKIGETNDQSVKGTSDVVWSLKDINFEIEQGDAVGIIGRNGAGKSTLLKILSRVTAPTTGRITGNGRIASLLEVGTGFHPELTGKENIFLNGAILGMRKKEIKRKFDSIVDFAGVQRYIDTPVKRYSSGMYVRLAFAVAAYLESEILIVDEVLAVGDAEFQKKCLGKMGEVSKGEGRTVLFVSHNMDAVQRLCKTSILLSKGLLVKYAKTEDVVSTYSLKNINQTIVRSSGSKELKLKNLSFLNSTKQEIHLLNTFEKIFIECFYEAFAEVRDVSFAVCFDNVNETRVTSLWTKNLNEFYNIQAGHFKIEFEINSLHLIPGSYNVILYVESQGHVIERIDNYKVVEVVYTSSFGFVYSPSALQGTYIETFKSRLNEIS